MAGIKITGPHTLFMFVCLVIHGDTMRCYFTHDTYDYKLSCKSPTPSELMRAMETVNITGTGSSLYMYKSNITKLPEGIFRFNKLSGITELSLSNNFVSELPGGLFNNSGLVHLKKLFLSYNKITELKPDQFNSLQNLKILNLSCNQIHSMETNAFTGLLNLEKLSIKRNKITELKDNQFMSLPRLVCLYLSYNRIQNMEPTVFKGLLNLKSLELDGNKIKVLKLNQFMFLPKLKSLFLKHNEIWYVEPGAFRIQNGSLEFIDLDFNHITTLPDDLFQGRTLTNLHGINLRDNNLCMIPKCIFTLGLLPCLKDIKLHGNNIQIIPSMPNFSLPKLENLHLERNNLTSIPSDLFDSKNWTALRKVRLKLNSISYLPSNVFSSVHLVNLEHICVSRNSLTLLPDGLFNNPALQKLKHLDFSYNMISVLPENLFNCSNLRNLKILSLHGNKIELLFDNPALQNLRYIDFQHNMISALSENLFNCRNLRNLERIWLHVNKIELLPDKLFQNKYLKTLRLIDLSQNKIKFIPSGFFKYLKNIERLNIAHNQIKHLTADMFPKTLKHLTRLDLSHNRISSIKEIIPLFLTYRKKPPLIRATNNSLSVQIVNFIGKHGTRILAEVDINLEFNNINSFEMFSNTRDAVYQYKVLRDSRFYVGGNKPFSASNLIKASLGIDLNHIDWLDLPSTINSDGLRRLSALIKYFRYKYVCDCEMLNYLKLSDTLFKLTKLVRWTLDIHPNDFTRLVCGTPIHLKDKYLCEIEKSDLQCQDRNCTNISQCTCTNTPFNNTVRINCTRINITDIPAVLKSSNLEVYLGFNKLKKFPIPNISMSERVLVLDVSYNYIQYVPLRFFSYYPNVTLLNLAGNHLTTLPSVSEWEMMNNLKDLKFAGNSFVCNCSGLDLQTSLSYLNSRNKPKSQVHDIGEIKCYMPLELREKVIYSLPESAFGCPFVNLTLILTVIFTVVLVIVITIFIGYVFRYYISLCLFVHCGWRFFYNYTQEKTIYDVFISYSSLDSDWVIDQLANPLEGMNPPYNLCLHERDFQVGIPICDNITKAIEGSKCTLVVVSRNWLESDWCQFEFRVAHCLATVEKKMRLLVILKEEIPDDKIEGDLQLYMKTFTYLDSANLLFWARLLNDLPAPDVDNKKGEGTYDGDNHRDDIELV